MLDSARSGSTGSWIIGRLIRMTRSIRRMGRNMIASRGTAAVRVLARGKRTGCPPSRRLQRSPAPRTSAISRACAGDSTLWMHPGRGPGRKGAVAFDRPRRPSLGSAIVATRGNVVWCTRAQESVVDESSPAGRILASSRPWATAAGAGTRSLAGAWSVAGSSTGRPDAFVGADPAAHLSRAQISLTANASWTGQDVGQAFGAVEL